MQKLKSVNFGNQQDLCDESLLEHATEQFTMWMMVLEIEQGHAENIPSLVEIQVPKSLHGSADTPKLFQLFKSTPCVLLTSMESRFRFLHIWKRRQILDCNIPRQKSLREWVTIQRSRLFSRKYRTSALQEHWGNSCETVNNSYEISVQCGRRLYSDYRKEFELI